MQPSLPFSLSVQYGLFIFTCMVGWQHSGRKNADVRDVCKKIYVFVQCSNNLSAIEVTVNKKCRLYTIVHNLKEVNNKKKKKKLIAH